MKFDGAPRSCGAVLRLGAVCRKALQTSCTETARHYAHPHSNAASVRPPSENATAKIWVTRRPPCVMLARRDKATFTPRSLAAIPSPSARQSASFRTGVPLPVFSQSATSGSNCSSSGGAQGEASILPLRISDFAALTSTADQPQVYFNSQIRHAG